MSKKTRCSYTGVDYFGPIYVKRCRIEVKRYGCIFTCLSIRAIHIEIVHTLDTNSFINALHRFIARRGKPIEIISDNGTNLVGANKEIRASLLEWNQHQIHESLLQNDIKWIFNPPAGSHHGGVWERCIRTVRKIMMALIKEQITDDEGLLTLMCEIESIVNGCPITTVSSDPRDAEALTLSMSKSVILSSAVLSVQNYKHWEMRLFQISALSLYAL